jgi:hypothetical protein
MMGLDSFNLVYGESAGSQDHSLPYEGVFSAASIGPHAGAGEANGAGRGFRSKIGKSVSGSEANAEIGR